MTKVKVKVEQELELGWEATQEVVVSSLREDFDILSNEITKLRMMPELQEYQKQDLIDTTEHRNAIYNTLKYYMSHDQFNMFMRNRSL